MGKGWKMLEGITHDMVKQRCKHEILQLQLHFAGLILVYPCKLKVFMLTFASFEEAE